MKTALELALMLLRILKEVLVLIMDMKDLRRPPKAKRKSGDIFINLRPPSCWRLFLKS